MTVLAWHLAVIAAFCFVTWFAIAACRFLRLIRSAVRGMRRRAAPPVTSLGLQHSGMGYLR
ncbi:MAG: hypothetical protein AAF532_15130 [Planctomycetota bacterium]